MVELRYYYFNKNLLLGIVTLIKLIFLNLLKPLSQFLRSSFKRVIHEYKINSFHENMNKKKQKELLL